MSEEAKKKIIFDIESAAASLLTDDEICQSLDISVDVLTKHYDVVEKARLKVKQKLNAKRILSANQSGNNIEELLKTIPDNDYRRKNIKTGEKKVTGIVVGRGENKKVIPPEEVFKLAKMWCTMQEIADWFEIPRETLKYNFSDLIAKGRAETKQALRKSQIKAAIGGNTSMMIWLGKNILGQSDQPVSNEANQILPWLGDSTEE